MASARALFLLLCLLCLIHGIGKHSCSNCCPDGVDAAVDRNVELGCMSCVYLPAAHHQHPRTPGLMYFNGVLYLRLPSRWAIVQVSHIHKYGCKQRCLSAPVRCSSYVVWLQVVTSIHVLLNPRSSLLLVDGSVEGQTCAPAACVALCKFPAPLSKRELRKQRGRKLRPSEYGYMHLVSLAMHRESVGVVKLASVLLDIKLTALRAFMHVPLYLLHLFLGARRIVFQLWCTARYGLLVRKVQGHAKALHASWEQCTQVFPPRSDDDLQRLSCYLSDARHWMQSVEDLLLSSTSILVCSSEFRTYLDEAANNIQVMHHYVEYMVELAASVDEEDHDSVDPEAAQVGSTACAQSTCGVTVSSSCENSSASCSCAACHALACQHPPPPACMHTCNGNSCVQTEAGTSIAHVVQQLKAVQVRVACLPADSCKQGYQHQLQCLTEQCMQCLFQLDDVACLPGSHEATAKRAAIHQVQQVQSQIDLLAEELHASSDSEAIPPPPPPPPPPPSPPPPPPDRSSSPPLPSIDLDDSESIEPPPPPPYNPPPTPPAPTAGTPTPAPPAPPAPHATPLTPSPTESPVQSYAIGLMRSNPEFVLCVCKNCHKGIPLFQLLHKLESRTTTPEELASYTGCACIPHVMLLCHCDATPCIHAHVTIMCWHS
jgi:hypothetical protein